MSETTTIQKGWLETRDGDKFAPNTLVENVYTRSGVKYDVRVREYIASINSGTNTQVTALAGRTQTLENKVKTMETNIGTNQNDIDNIEKKFSNFNVDDSEVFYIIDKDEDVIAYVDGNGVHSFDFETKGGTRLSEVPTQLTSLSGQISDLTNKINNVNAAIKNINAEDSDVLYIIDNAEEVIAFIDKEGIHSFDFFAKDIETSYRELISLVNNHTTDIGNLKSEDVEYNSRISTLEENTKNFNGSDSSTFYITDGTDNQNIIAYFDDSGLHVINVLIGSVDASGNEVNKSYNLYNTLILLESSIQIEKEAREKAIADEKKAREQADSDHSRDIAANSGNITTVFSILGENKVSGQGSHATQLSDHETRLDDIENIVGGDGGTLYIIDGDNNTIAYFNNSGLTAHNVIVENTQKSKMKNLQLNGIYIKSTNSVTTGFNITI